MTRSSQQPGPSLQVKQSLEILEGMQWGKQSKAYRSLLPLPPFSPPQQQLGPRQRHPKAGPRSGIAQHGTQNDQEETLEGRRKALSKDKGECDGDVFPTR